LAVIKRSLSLTLLVIFFLLLSLISSEDANAQASARVQGVVLNAASMYRDSENETMELEGNVQIVYQAQHIKCDKARVNFRTRQAELIGHVEIVSPKTSVVGTMATIDYENNTGVIYDGYVQSGPAIFSGTMLQKVGEDEYYVSNADYTSCANCPPSWSFSGSNIRAELGGYAYIKNSFFKVYSVPVFWLPYLIVPLKSDRQSGLLTPNFESSATGGLTLTNSYFWAISRSSDATFSFKNYELRGAKALVEYRYMLNETSNGTFSGAFLDDRAFRDDKRLLNFESDEQKGQSINRWFVKYDHYYDMPNDYVQRTQVNLASDLQYPKDFDTETLNHGDPAMENRVSLTKNTFQQHFSIDTSYYVNLLQSNPLAGNSNAVHRLPELRFAQTAEKIGDSKFLYSLDVDYTNFSRAGQSFDNMSLTPDGRLRYLTNARSLPNYDQLPDSQVVQDGNFDPATDLLRTGQRLDLNTALFRPINIGDVVDIMPTLAYRETYYNFNAGDDRNNVRRYLRTSISAKTSFSRVFDMDEGPRGTKYKHEFEPEIIATAIPWIDHPKHPFFSYGSGDETDGSFYSTDRITDNDLVSPYGLQFDYYDRVYDRGLVTFALNNKLVQKSWSADTAQYLQVANFRISQSYDTYQANLRNRTRDPWSNILAVLDVRFPHVQTYTTLDYFPPQKVSNISSRVRLINDDGQFVQVALTKSYQVTPGVADIDLNKTRLEDYALSSGFVSRYINLMGKVVYDANWENAQSEQKIKSWGYIAQFKPAGNCWVINFTQYQVTGGEPNWKFDFEFTFDGVPRAPLPPENLDTF
jgi:LPS-assembly protein